MLKYKTFGKYCEAIGHDIIDAFMAKKTSALAIEYIMIDLIDTKMIYTVSAANTIAEKKDMMLMHMYIHCIKVEKAREALGPMIERIVNLRNDKETKKEIANYNSVILDEKKKIIERFHSRVKEAIYYKIPVVIKINEFVDSETCMVPIFTREAFTGYTIDATMEYEDKQWFFKTTRDDCRFDMKKCNEYDFYIQSQHSFFYLASHINRNEYIHWVNCKFEFDDKGTKQAQKVHESLTMLPVILRRSRVFMSADTCDELKDFIAALWNNIRANGYYSNHIASSERVATHQHKRLKFDDVFDERDFE